MRRRLKRSLSVGLLFGILVLTSTNFANPSKLERIEGENRYERAVKLSESLYPDGTGTVVVESGEDFPDALSSGPLAALLDGPVLLVGGDISKGTLDEIQRLGPSRILAIGGKSSVSEDIENKLAQVESAKITLSKKTQPLAPMMAIGIS